MKTLLAVVGLCGLLAIAYHVGNRTDRDPFAG